MDEIPPFVDFIKGTFFKVTATDHVPKKGQKNTKQFQSVVISGIQAIEGCYNYKFCTNKALCYLTVVIWL